MVLYHEAQQDVLGQLRAIEAILWRESTDATVQRLDLGHSGHGLQSVVGQWRPRAQIRIRARQRREEICMRLFLQMTLIQTTTPIQCSRATPRRPQ